MFAEHTLSEIEEAQEVIRQITVEEAGRTDREALRLGCHVSRFDEFYEYYLSFINEIRGGPLSRRMTKSRKNKVMEKLKEGI